MEPLPSILGIDPAVNGAAILLYPDGGRIQAAWIWTDRSRGGCRVSELVSCQDKGGVYRVVTRRSVAPLGVLGEVIREEARVILGGKAYELVVENAIVGRAMDTSIIIARNSGRIIGPLEALAIGQTAEWVRATVWRQAILNLPFKTPRDEAKATSKQLMPLRLPSLVEVAKLLGDPDDLYDAAGITQWRASQLSSLGSLLPAKPQRKKRPVKSSKPGLNTRKKGALL